MVAKGSPALDEIAKAFGTEYLQADGELNRAKMAELVFNDKAALKKLEGIIHKNVHARRRAFWLTAAVKICLRRCWTCRC